LQLGLKGTLNVFIHKECFCWYAHLTLAAVLLKPQIPIQVQHTSVSENSCSLSLFTRSYFSSDLNGFYPNIFPSDFPTASVIWSISSGVAISAGLKHSVLFRPGSDRLVAPIKTPCAAQSATTA